MNHSSLRFPVNLNFRHENPELGGVGTCAWQEVGVWPRFRTMLEQPSNTAVCQALVGTEACWEVESWLIRTV